MCNILVLLSFFLYNLIVCPCLFFLIKTCNQLILFHLNYLHEDKYNFQIKFSTINENKIKNLQFILNTLNSKYTQFELLFRFIYLTCSLIATCLFTKSMQRFSIYDWSLEQRWMVILLIFLIFYNDPFYPLTFLLNNSFFSIVDKILQTTFLCILLFFWLSIYHGIRQTVRRFLPFYCPKLILICLLWILSIILSIQEFRDPLYNLTIDITHFTTIQIIFYFVGLIYILYLVFLIIRAFDELRNMPYFDIRLKFITILMFSIVFMMVLIISFRFSSGIMEENFLPELTSYYKNSAEFLSIYSLINFYLYTMAFVYSPAKNATIDSLFHDNPTFSMINDSDEDIVYGD